jgi:transcriptional regulator with XRE-family HTH domain
MNAVFQTMRPREWRPYRPVYMPKFSRERFVEILKRSGLNQTQLAKASGVPQNSISDYLSGKVKEPKASHLYRLADGIGVSCEEFRKPVGADIEWLPPTPPDDS